MAERKRADSSGLWVIIIIAVILAGIIKVGQGFNNIFLTYKGYDNFCVSKGYEGLVRPDGVKTINNEIFLKCYSDTPDDWEKEFVTRYKIFEYVEPKNITVKPRTLQDCENEQKAFENMFNRTNEFGLYYNLTCLLNDCLLNSSTNNKAEIVGGW